MRTWFRQEIIWGQLLWIALLATLLAGFAYIGSLDSNNQLLSLLALAIMAIGGIVVARRAPSHPFLNALIYGLFCDFFAVGLLSLYNLGIGGIALSFEDAGGALLNLGVFILPQVLAGAFIARTFQRARQMGEDSAGGKQEKNRSLERGRKKGRTRKKG